MNEENTKPSSEVQQAQTGGEGGKDQGKVDPDPVREATTDRDGRGLPEARADVETAKQQARVEEVAKKATVDEKSSSTTGAASGAKGATSMYASRAKEDGAPGRSGEILRGMGRVSSLCARLPGSITEALSAIYGPELDVRAERIFSGFGYGARPNQETLDRIADRAVEYDSDNEGGPGGSGTRVPVGRLQEREIDDHAARFGQRRPETYGYVRGPTMQFNVDDADAEEALARSFDRSFTRAGKKYENVERMEEWRRGLKALESNGASGRGTGAATIGARILSLLAEPEQLDAIARRFDNKAVLGIGEVKEVLKVTFEAGTYAESWTSPNNATDWDSAATGSTTSADIIELYDCPISWSERDGSLRLAIWILAHVATSNFSDDPSTKRRRVRVWGVGWSGKASLVRVVNDDDGRPAAQADEEEGLPFPPLDADPIEQYRRRNSSEGDVEWWDSWFWLGHDPNRGVPPEERADAWDPSDLDFVDSVLWGWTDSYIQGDEGPQLRAPEDRGLWISALFNNAEADPSDDLSLAATFMYKYWAEVWRGTGCVYLSLLIAASHLYGVLGHTEDVTNWLHMAADGVRIECAPLSPLVEWAAQRGYVIKSSYDEPVNIPTVPYQLLAKGAALITALCLAVDREYALKGLSRELAMCGLRPRGARRRTSKWKDIETYSANMIARLSKWFVGSGMQFKQSERMQVSLWGEGTGIWATNVSVNRHPIWLWQLVFFGDYAPDHEVTTDFAKAVRLRKAGTGNASYINLGKELATADFPGYVVLGEDDRQPAPTVIWVEATNPVITYPILVQAPWVGIGIEDPYFSHSLRTEACLPWYSFSTQKEDSWYMEMPRYSAGRILQLVGKFIVPRDVEHFRFNAPEVGFGVISDVVGRIFGDS